MKLHSKWHAAQSQQNSFQSLRFWDDCACEKQCESALRTTEAVEMLQWQAADARRPHVRPGRLTICPHTGCKVPLGSGSAFLAAERGDKPAFRSSRGATGASGPQLSAKRKGTQTHLLCELPMLLSRCEVCSCRTGLLLSWFDPHVQPTACLPRTCMAALPDHRSAQIWERKA